MPTYPATGVTSSTDGAVVHANSSGPYPAAGTPPAAYAVVFDAVRKSLLSISDLSPKEKLLDFYDVLSTDDDNAVFVELAPHLAKNESAHLGCKTILGRDMLFRHSQV